MTQDLLAGRKVLITGSSRGIGRASAIAMAKQGADVAVHYHRQSDLAGEVAAEIRRLGCNAITVQAELESLEDVDRMFDAVSSAFGGLDVYVANAAATAFKPLLEMKPHHIDRTYRLLIQSLLRAAQRAVPLMEGRGGGRILAVSGHGVRFTLPQYGSIGSAKGAEESLIRYLANELGPHQITCNSVAPGVVDTDSARFYKGDAYAAFEQAVSAHTPLGRLATPQDVADTLVFLASDMARFITGQVICVDGGLTLTSGPFEITK